MFTHLRSRFLASYLILLSGIVLLNSNTEALTKQDTGKYLNQDLQIYNPLDNIVWTKVQNYGGVWDIGSPHYLDVISHTDSNDPICPRGNGMIFSQSSIRIHETEHMLHCQILSRFGKNDQKFTGIYYQNGNGILFSKPKAKVTDFAYLIPQELRDVPSPYQTYIVEQMQYPSLNNIGYLFDEWASYRSNIILNLELEKAGIPEPDADSHAANYSPHFFGYLAIAMHHLRMIEPQTLNDEQFKATFALYAEESWRLMHDALNSPVFGRADTIYGSRIQKVMDFYRNSPKFADVRNSLIAIYGKEWVVKLMQ